MYVLRGAQDRVLRVLLAKIMDGCHDLSYLDLSIESGYSMESVRCAIRDLEHKHYIRVIRGGPRRRNRYEVLSEEQRRMYSVAQLVGLLQ